VFTPIPKYLLLANNHNLTIPITFRPDKLTTKWYFKNSSKLLCSLTNEVIMKIDVPAITNNSRYTMIFNTVKTVENPVSITLSKLLTCLLVCCVFLIPVTARSSITLPPIYHLLFNSNDSNQKIFIIGDSTVHLFTSVYQLNVKRMTCGDDNLNNEYQGWGDPLRQYAIHPDNVINRARAGSSSVTYRSPDYDEEKFGVNRFWGSTREMMEAAGGGILLIQFGSGNENHNVPGNTDYDGDGDVDADDAIIRRGMIKTLFDESIGIYINEARELGFTPFLVTTPDGRNDNNPLPDGSHPASRGLFPGYVRSLGLLHNVEVLDLNVKTNTEFAKYSEATLDAEFGDCKNHRADGSVSYIDRVHYEPHGAQKVAGWIKELACTELNNKLLCNQFSTTTDRIIPTLNLTGSYSMTLAQGDVFVDPGATAIDDVDGDLTANIVSTDNINSNIPGTYSVVYTVNDSSNNAAIPLTRIVNVSTNETVHDDAEDGNTIGWSLYGVKAGSSATNIAGNGGRVIRLSGNDGLDNGYHFDGIRVNNGFIASWSMNFSAANNFRIFFQIRTSNFADNQNVFFEYTPDQISTGYRQQNGNHYLHFGLETNANNGTWRTFTRDLEADLHVLFPDDTLEEVIAFNVRGNGFIDDIKTSFRFPTANFTYAGHTYEIVKTALSWQDASTAAQNSGGYLANIGSIAENHEIYSRLYRCIEQNEYANTETTMSNGGGASYVWIGANDVGAANEGTWRWTGSNQNFWTGTFQDGGPVGNAFNSWGRNTNEEQREPDNAGNNQDAAALAITRWPIGSGSRGQTSQWNDLITATELYYIIERN